MVPCDAYSYWAADSTPYTWETNLEYRYSRPSCGSSTDHGSAVRGLPGDLDGRPHRGPDLAPSRLVPDRPGLNDDVLRGNISTFIALFAVLAIQRSAAWWAPVLLTKITPAVGLVWHTVRREWRSFAMALA